VHDSPVGVSFEILVARPALKETDRSASPHIEMLREQFRLLAVWSGLAAMVSGIVWFWIVLARMTGCSMWEMPGIRWFDVAITQTHDHRAHCRGTGSHSAAAPSHVMN